LTAAAEPNRKEQAAGQATEPVSQGNHEVTLRLLSPRRSDKRSTL
jgi:hypothetical protein